MLFFLFRYCTNVTFYITLKAKRVSIANHPVIKRLVTFRNLLKQLEPVDKKLSDEVNMLLEKLSRGEDIVPLTTSAQKMRAKPKLRITRQMQEKAVETEVTENPKEEQVKGKEKKIKVKRKHTEEEQAILDMYAESRKKVRFESGSDSDEESKIPENEDELDQPCDSDAEGEQEDFEGEGGDDRRGITYQIAKNKGLTAKRKKEYRNPRVRHKMKYRRAKISRKGQVREARTELQKYGGEVSGIRAGVTRSIKMK